MVRAFQARRFVPVALLLLVGLVARAPGWRQGLPEFFDEAQPLRQALKMWRPGGAVDWNPHFFVYPSLTFYFHLVIQWIQLQVGSVLGVYQGVADFLLEFETDPTLHALVGRLAVTGVDLATILGTVALGERLSKGAGLAAGLLVALAPNGIETSRALYAEAHLAAFTVWALERMVAHLRRGDAGSLMSGAALTGLAASSKYPGALLLLLLPLLGAALLAAAPMPLARRLARAASAGLVAALTFALTSPYVLLDWSAARSDLQVGAELARAGHLGHLGRTSADFYLLQMLRDPGAVVLALAVLAPFLVRRDALSRRAFAPLGLAVVPLLATVSLSSVIAPRYVVSVVPVLAVCAAVAATLLMARVPALSPRWRTLGAVLALSISIAPAAWSAFSQPKRDTRSAALAWCRRVLTDRDLVFCESGGPALLGSDRREAVQSSRVYRDASTEAQRRYLARRAFNQVSWPLFMHGDLQADAGSGGPPRWRTVIPEAVDFNAAFYDRRLIGLADYFITSSVVRSRYQADSTRFAVEVHAYDSLERDATLVARFVSDRAQSGPEIRIYRIDESARARWRANLGALDARWWLSTLPPDSPLQGAGSAEGADPSAPEPRRLLSDFHYRYVAPTIEHVTRGLLRAGRSSDAAPLERVSSFWETPLGPR